MKNKTKNKTNFKLRQIVVVTGTRAEFGLLNPVMQQIQSHPQLALQTVVAGLHWVQGSWRDVKQAGYCIDAKARMQQKNDVGRWADVQAVGRGIGVFGRLFEKLSPQVVLVLGDRVEAFAAASAASLGGVLVAHIHGGDRAEGIADEAMRHAISKLAHLHFAASEQSRKRLVRMGEQPEYVWNTGSPAIDGLNQVAAADDALVQAVGLDFTKPYLIVLQHPVGESAKQEQQWMSQTLQATKPYQCLVLSPNGDAGSEGIIDAIAQIENKSSKRFKMIRHLPRPDFLQLLTRAAALVGNSSAGLIEASALGNAGVAVVNIGPRQAGRERAKKVVDCDYGPKKVAAAIALALKQKPRRATHPYGHGDAGARIANLLATIALPSSLIRKQNTY